MAFSAQSNVISAAAPPGGRRVARTRTRERGARVSI